MAKNEFLPFGTAANANIIPNDDYQVLPARTAGFGSGVAKSEELNSVWRQASTIASVVAQFIVNKSGMDALDNGDTAGLLESLELAFAAQAKEILPFTQSLNPTGYQKLPSGLIVQWGNETAGNDGSKHVLFPTPYPNKVFIVIPAPTNRFNANTMIGVNVDNTNYQLTGFDIVSYSLDLENSKVIKGGNGFTWVSFGK